MYAACWPGRDAGAAGTCSHCGTDRRFLSRGTDSRCTCAAGRVGRGARPNLVKKSKRPRSLALTNLHLVLFFLVRRRWNSWWKCQCLPFVSAPCSRIRGSETLMVFSGAFDDQQMLVIEGWGRREFHSQVTSTGTLPIRRRRVVWTCIFVNSRVKQPLQPQPQPQRHDSSTLLSRSTKQFEDSPSGTMGQRSELVANTKIQNY